MIFPAGPADADDLARVHVASWRETYRGLLPEAYLARMSVEAHARRWRWALTHPGEEEVTLAAADRGGLVGYASGGPSRTGRPGEGEIHTLYVLRGVQGHGLGRRLARDAARALAATGARALRISVLRDNANARRFYEHLGGMPEPPRQEPGPAGVMFEVAYLWPDIGVLTEGGS
ncbi:GNAT family N-acetyltransferase [Phenylobacterium sp.]|uniref:GNAT family N-acetyltransferase n=1 Tax=Phenylobacterium sp. TaxID=1871053 RepID=UPI002F42070C